MEKIIPTRFTKLLSCEVPIIAGPMFLVSNVELVVAVSHSGGIGGMPSLNWRKTEDFQAAVRQVKSLTNKPFAVNIIVNKSAPRQMTDLKVCADEGVPMVVTSLGNPKEVIEQMHRVGGKVFCDVTNLEYAKKVQDLGADGVIAVGAGAGGHAGPTSPLVLIPYLAKNLQIPVVAAGGITTGEQILACLVLGASAVQMGTRFIASREVTVSEKYKNAIVESTPDDIVLTLKLSGVPASVINTPYIKKIGTDLSWLEAKIHAQPKLRKYSKMLRYYLGTKSLETAADKNPTWKEVWSAGQGVGLIDEILPAAEIMSRLKLEYFNALRAIKTT